MEIPRELKNEKPSEVRKRIRNLQWSFKTPWINRIFEA
jgi:hypothetical protein